MRKQLTILSGVLAAWALSSAPALAFQETHTEVQPSHSLNNSNAGGLSLDLQATAPEDPEEESGRRLKLELQDDGTVNVLPKLNFGLDVMYGSPGDEDPIAHAAPVQDLDDGNGIQVLGKFKRRF